MSEPETTNRPEETSDDIDRRDILKMSTLVSTSAAFSALAIAGSQNAAAYGTSDADQNTGLSASMSEEEIAALPRVKQELVAPPFAPEHEQVASGGPRVVEVTLTTPEVKMEIDGNGTDQPDHSV